MPQTPILGKDYSTPYQTPPNPYSESPGIASANNNRQHDTQDGMNQMSSVNELPIQNIIIHT